MWCRHREQTLDTVGEGESRMNWESSIETYALPCVKQTAVGSCRITQEHSVVLWQPRGVGRGEAQTGGDTCVLMADSFCMAEANVKL